MTFFDRVRKLEKQTAKLERQLCCINNGTDPEPTAARFGVATEDDTATGERKFSTDGNNFWISGDSADNTYFAIWGGTDLDLWSMNPLDSNDWTEIYQTYNELGLYVGSTSFINMNGVRPGTQNRLLGLASNDNVVSIAHSGSLSSVIAKQDDQLVNVSTSVQISGLDTPILNNTGIEFEAYISFKCAEVSKNIALVMQLVGTTVAQDMVIPAGKQHPGFITIELLKEGAATVAGISRHILDGTALSTTVDYQYDPGVDEWALRIKGQIDNVTGQNGTLVFYAGNLIGNSLTILHSSFVSYAKTHQY